VELIKLVPVAAQSGAHVVLDCLKAEIMSSNLVPGMDVWLRISVLCRWRPSKGSY
jgi:hypothetical protein